MDAGSALALAILEIGCESTVVDVTAEGSSKVRNNKVNGYHGKIWRSNFQENDVTIGDFSPGTTSIFGVFILLFKLERVFVTLFSTTSTLS